VMFEAEWLLFAANNRTGTGLVLTTDVGLIEDLDA